VLAHQRVLAAHLEVNGQAVDALQPDRGVVLMLQVLNPTLDAAQLSKEISQ